MALNDTDLQRIGDYVKVNLYRWLLEVAPHVVAVPQILERLERIEQELVVQRHELKAQRELMEARFAAVDKRFEDMNKRFEDMNERFGDMNKRFTGMQWMVGGGFALLGAAMTVFKFLV